MVCKVVKKGVIATAIGVGLAALLFGRGAPYYARTAIQKVRHSAQDAVPVQYEIDRARQQVTELEPAIHKNVEEIARAEVEIEYLDREIAATQANLDEQGKKLVALRDHLKDGDLKLTGGVSYTEAEIKSELARQLDHYRTVKAILADKQATLNLRKKALISAREQNNKMRAAKVELMTRIEGIETHLRQIEATNASNEFTFDDSALSRAKQTVAELGKRVEVIARVAEQEGRYADQGMPLVLEPGRDVVKEIDSEFGIDQGGKAPRDGKNL